MKTYRFLILVFAFVVLSTVQVGSCAASSGNIKEISAGGGHVLILLSNGTVWAWGENLDGACGQTIDSDYDQNFFPSPVMVEGLSNVTAVSAGNGFSIVLKDDGTVWAWGDNGLGKLGLGLPQATNEGGVRITKPTMIPGLSNIVSIDASDHFTLALKDDGTVWAWGLNAFGTLGDGMTTTEGSGYVTAPIQVTGLCGVKSIHAGAKNCFALKNDGTVWAWGENNSLLCDMTRTTEGSVISTPGQILNLTNIKSLAVGDDYALGLKDDGTVWVWGYDYYGSFGTGSQDTGFTYSSTPVQISGLSNIMDVKASTHSVALDSRGIVWTWGLNDNGQLGDGTTKTRSPPVQMHVTKATLITCSTGNTFTVGEDGTIYGCGDNQNYVLGERKSIDEYIAVPVKIGFDYGRAQSEPTATISADVTPDATEQPVVTDQIEPSPSGQAGSTPGGSSLLLGVNSILMIAVVLFTVAALGFIVYLVIRR